ncbi:MAG: hypothetical protein OEV74_06195 [Cyclobacteriaceae bacterium]|nr:hypothetical protein [Cyclobacteriaceae bacterium]
MEKINKLLQHFSPEKMKVSFKSLVPGISIMILVAFLNLLFNCSYYKVRTIDPPTNASVTEQVKNREKYIIIHSGEKAWHYKDITLSDSGKEITGVLEPIRSNHLYYLNAKKKSGGHLYKSNPAKTDLPIHEIHIFTFRNLDESAAEVTVPITDIIKLQVYDPDIGAQVGAIVGTVAGVLVVVAIIVAATKSSCPFVYTSAGDAYKFAGEMFGGAIYPALERDDYMPLPNLIPREEYFSLKISNELLERQYTNLANLVVVQHPKNSKVILDKYGETQTIKVPVSPFRAESDTHSDLMDKICLKDSTSYLFDEDVEDGKDLSSLVMSFRRPANARSGKLILNAKNSCWLDYAYGKFNEEFGIYYNRFAEKQKKEPAARLTQWGLEQQIPLSVYLETEAGWKLVDYLNTIGPLASRDMILSIDLSQVKGDEINIRLECGFMFWELDYAAMDFTENIQVQVSHIKPLLALDELNHDVASLIAETDDSYLIQPEIGNVVTIRYAAAKPDDGNTQTVFLHSRGYYEYIRDYQNIPNVMKLKSFREEGSFTHFSKEKYHEFISSQDLFAAVLTQHHEN